jgi:hypothetical protein
MTFLLLGAASEVLKIPAETVLEAFGEHWFCIQRSRITAV